MFAQPLLLIIPTFCTLRLTFRRILKYNFLNPANRTSSNIHFIISTNSLY